MIIDIPGVSDRRQTPRYEIELSVDMVLENGNILTVATRNISSCGLQIICDTWTTDAIEPRGIQSHAVSHIRIKTVTELPIGDETKKLYTNCRMLSVQRLSQNEYMLNLAFIDFENGSEQILDKFLDQYDQKKTVINAIS
ncbi:MAG: PilZ domain-containing protein [Thiohalomonadales bacterium]